MENRTIKFRAWNVDDKTMDTDFYISADNGVYQNSSTRWDISDTAIVSSYDELIIMQFIGLTDKNGKDIYEGDMVNCVFSEPQKETVKYEVFFDEQEAMFKLRNNLGYCMLTHRTIEIEIIGNIHQTPER